MIRRVRTDHWTCLDVFKPSWTCWLDVLKPSWTCLDVTFGHTPMPYQVAEMDFFSNIRQLMNNFKTPKKFPLASCFTAKLLVDGFARNFAQNII